MLDVFGQVKSFLKLQDVKIDNRVFQLHYKLTGAILVAFSLLVTSKQYIGDPIDCVVDEIPQKVMDSYCWIYSTFTVPEKLSGRVGKDVIHPGVAGHVDGEDNVKHHQYYQWVCFTLIFQAILFQVPRYIWKAWEAGQLKNLAYELHNPAVDKDTKKERLERIRTYFKLKDASRDRTAYVFFICEVLNLINVIGQIYFMDFFLDGEFSSYGSDVVKFTEMEPENRFDPMARVFPKVTKCTFNKFGPSGTVQRFDGLCVLPLNIVNEKIYVFLWFWFIILSVLTAIQVLVDAITISSQGIRKLLLSVNGNGKKADYVSKLPYGDWFMIYQMRDVIDPLIYQDVLDLIGKNVEPSTEASSEDAKQVSSPKSVSFQLGEEASDNEVKEVNPSKKASFKIVKKEDPPKEASSEEVKEVDTPKEASSEEAKEVDPLKEASSEEIKEVDPPKVASSEEIKEVDPPKVASSKESI